MLCNFYIVAVTALLPLYNRGTYVLLGDEKYGLFRGLAILCLGFAVAAALVSWLPKHDFKEIAFSSVDICMLLYAGASAVSALCSKYGETAWMGYREWYMGAVSQLIFVGTFFFASRQYRGSRYPIYLWETVFFLVALLGLCSRLGLDPLGLLKGFNSGDWEYSHLISTIGNINWFCGYVAVALAMPAAGFLKGRNFKERVLLYPVSVLGLLLLFIQGSDIGPVLAAVCLGVCLLWSRGENMLLRRTLLLAAGMAICLPCYGNLAVLRGDAALRALPADGIGISVLCWGGWWIIGFLLLGLYFVLLRFPAECVGKGLWLGLVLLGATGLLLGCVLYMGSLLGSSGWNNGRGALWRLSWQGFLRGDWKQKLLGAGPDCFAEYIYSTFAPSEMFTTEGYWAGAVFANAHNQWLTHLVNTGLLGFCCAVGIAVTSVRRYRRYLPGLLALAMYGVNSLVSFQQVLSTPMFFLLLGICEYRVRKCEKNF